MKNNFGYFEELTIMWIIFCLYFRKETNTRQLKGYFKPQHRQDLNKGVKHLSLGS